MMEESCPRNRTEMPVSCGEGQVSGIGLISPRGNVRKCAGLLTTKVGQFKKI